MNEYIGEWHTLHVWGEPEDLGYGVDHPATCVWEPVDNPDPFEMGHWLCDMAATDPDANFWDRGIREPGTYRIRCVVSTVGPIPEPGTEAWDESVEIEVAS